MGTMLQNKFDIGDDGGNGGDIEIGDDGDNGGNGETGDDGDGH